MDLNEVREQKKKLIKEVLRCMRVVHHDTTTLGAVIPHIKWDELTRLEMLAGSLLKGLGIDTSNAQFHEYKKDLMSWL